jgi:two-component system sensor histidine kinase YesM
MNINNRLKLKFGDEYGIYINSRINEGTTVTVKIPLLGEEVDNV